MATRTGRAASVLGLAVMGVALAGELRAGTMYTFAYTGGGAYNWNADNWAASGQFPNGIDDTANLNANFTGNTTLSLGVAAQNITVGTLNLGDSDGTNTVTVQSGYAGNMLVFQSAGTASLNLIAGGTAHPVSTISAPIDLQSALTISLGAPAAVANAQQYLTFNGNVTTNGKNITLTDGFMSQKLSGVPVGGGVAYTNVAGVNSFNLNGDLVGAGTLTNNSGGPINITQYTTAGVKSFKGKVVLNNGRGSSASGYFGSLMLNGLSSIKDASELEVNGYTLGGTATPADNGMFRMGGSVNVGDNQGVPSNPGQRLPSAKITLNGGTLLLNGQKAAAGWTTASSDVVTDTVSTLAFNSGMAFIGLVRDSSTAGTTLHATTVQRNPGAALYIGNTDGTYATTKFLIDNGASLLVGGSGSTTTNKPIIPWMMERYNNAGYKNPTGFVTYDAALGVKALTSDATTAYATFASTDPTDNVSSGSFTVAASQTVNSLRIASGTITINKGQILTVTSGALMLQGGTVNTASTGTGTDGTLDFGGREGIIWENQTDTSFTLGARITGSGGLTKYGFSRLILSGNNAYTGQTYVGNGILQVGIDGTTVTKLGDGDVHVAAGSTLDIRATADVIADSASVWLATYGPASNGVIGKVNLGASVTETVGGLYFGDVAQVAGTWGATGSGAANINNDYFTGSGILTVVPEPGTLGLLGVVVLGMLQRRRR